MTFFAKTGIKLVESEWVPFKKAAKINPEVKYEAIVRNANYGRLAVRVVANRRMVHAPSVLEFDGAQMGRPSLSSNSDVAMNYAQSKQFAKLRKKLSSLHRDVLYQLRREGESLVIFAFPVVKDELNGVQKHPVATLSR